MNRTPPEGAKTAYGVGDDLAAAIKAAAAELDLPAEGVHWALDKTWFRNEFGGMVPRDDVRVIAWGGDPEERAALTEAKSWLEKVLTGMDLKGSVDGKIGPNGAVRLVVDVDKGGRLVGRRGSTLKAVRHLLMQTVGADFPDRDFSIDVADGRREDEEGGERRGRDDDRRGRDDDRRGRDDDRRGRDDDRRGRDDERPRRDDERPRRDDDRRGRGRDDDRRGRGRDDDRRGRGRDDDRRGRGDRDGGRRSRTSEDDAQRLRKLAEKIAQRVVETGESEVIRKELNSFDRRIVHVSLVDYAGVGTRSIGEGSHKQIEIFASDGSGEE